MEHVTYRGAVHLHHLDHMGHMNVQHYVGMFDHATWILIAELGLTAEWFREQNCGMAALEQNIQYKRELRAGDVIEIHSGVLELGNKTMRITHEMRHFTGGWVAAPGVSRTVERMASLVGIQPIDEDSPEIRRSLMVALPTPSGRKFASN